VAISSDVVSLVDNQATMAGFSQLSRDHAAGEASADAKMPVSRHS
jgi:hypothetical protein